MARLRSVMLQEVMLGSIGGLVVLGVCSGGLFWGSVLNVSDWTISASAAYVLWNKVVRWGNLAGDTVRLIWE
jgi:hypothetical protein